MLAWQCKTMIPVLALLVLFGDRSWAQDASEERLRRDVTYLASDECEGRGVGTKGLDKASEYIARQFAEAGLLPGGVKGTYFQPFTVSGSSKLDGPSSLSLKGPLGQTIQLKVGDHFQVMGLSGSGKVSAPLVFVGFGAVAKDIGYDDYKGVDVAGKIVVMLRHTPRWSNANAPFDGPRKDEHASLEKKQSLAEIHKAAAVILVNDLSEAGDKLMPFTYIAGGTPSSIPGLHVHRNILDPVFQSALNMTLSDVEKAIDRDLKPQSAMLTGWSASIETGVKRETVAVRNVIGVVPGHGPLANETVVVGAHYDHLGYGGRGSRSPSSKDIHHGADDNASGTTTMLELARRFAKMEKRDGRRVVFMAFSAEEMGLLGSRHYTNKEPLFPLENTVAMVNLDMVGRVVADPMTKKSKLIVEGLGTAKGFEQLIEKFNGKDGFQLSKKQGGTGPSDHDSFFRKKIPVLFFWTGTHADYHKPSDTSDKINVTGMKKIADLASQAIDHFATDAKRPEFIQVASTTTPMSPAGKGPRLGIIPDYEEGREGLLVGGVQDGGPAATAGIKGGDVIVEIAGKSVKNINTYMVLMAQQQVGQTVEIGVLRGGKKLQLKVNLK